MRVPKRLFFGKEFRKILQRDSTVNLNPTIHNPAPEAFQTNAMNTINRALLPCRIVQYNSEGLKLHPDSSHDSSPYRSLYRCLKGTRSLR